MRWGPAMSPVGEAVVCRSLLGGNTVPATSTPSDKIHRYLST